MQRLSTVLTVGLLALGSASVYADQSCETVKMADPGWSDIAATNAITGFLLDGMGYKAKIDTLAVPITFGGLKDGQVDVFLGNWMPAQQGFYDKFDHKIYGIGSGAPANISLQEIIKKNDFDMGQWKLIESSEQAMLAEVSRAVKKQKFVTFLGWTPHPMNVQLKMHYLKGGEKYFGDTGSVHTLTRKGYAQACPNVGKLLTNLSFTPDMENSIMAEVVNKKVSNADAAKAWIKANPAVLDKWLDGVKTVDGKDALPAVKAKL
jgi:glycine betaine/proline transport system substrate-binding protein